MIFFTVFVAGEAGLRSFVVRSFVVRPKHTDGAASGVCCRPLLDELTLPGVSRCGLNVPCPDRVTPMRVASSMWSWAEGHPTSLLPQNGTSHRPQQQPAQSAAAIHPSSGSSGSSSRTGAAVRWVAGGLQRLWQRVWPSAATAALQAENAVRGRASSRHHTPYP